MPALTETREDITETGWCAAHLARNVGYKSHRILDISATITEIFLSLIRVFSMYVITDFLDIISSQCKMCLFYTCELVNSIVVTECYNILVR